MSTRAMLNTAITRRNIERRRGNTRLMLWWEAQAQYLADRLHTKLIPAPGRPGAIIPAFWAAIL